MIVIKKIFFIGITLFTFSNCFAQFEKGQKAIGGEFLIFNTTNNFSESESGFSTNTGAGISLNFNKGKFFRKNLYGYGSLFWGYNNTFRETEGSDALGINLDRSRNTNITIGLGAGLRKYYPATEKIGLYLNGSIGANITRAKEKNYASVHDTVLKDLTQVYPFYNASISIVPGVYVMLNPKWQLNFNIGNLYVEHTLRPSRKGIVNYRSTTTMGLNFNIFDFRLGVLYMPGRVPKKE